MSLHQNICTGLIDDYTTSWCWTIGLDMWKFPMQMHKYCNDVIIISSGD